MIANLHDIVEKKFSEMSTWLDASLADRGKKVIAKFEASLTDQVKDEVRKEFHSCCGVGVYRSERELFGRLRDLFMREDGIARKRLVLLISL